MSYNKIKEAAVATLKWMQSEAGHTELRDLAYKFGPSDGWHIVYAIRKVSPSITVYEDICAIVAELRIIRRLPAIKARVSA